MRSARFVWLDFVLAGGFQRGPIKQRRLGRNDLHQVVPRLNKGFGTFALKLHSQGIDIDTSSGELSQNFLTVSAIDRQQLAKSVWVAPAATIGLLFRFRSREEPADQFAGRCGGGEAAVELGLADGVEQALVDRPLFDAHFEKVVAG